MNNFIKYWSYLVENENKEESFETFLNKKSNLFEASKKWPEDYLKQAKNRIMDSPLGKLSWYTEDLIDYDLINNFYNEFETFAKKGDFTLGFFPSIIKWFIEYSGSDKQKYQEFIEGKLDKIIGILNYVVSQKDDEVSQFHEINKKDKDDNGNPRVYRFKKLKDMDWNTFEKEIFQKYSDEISKSVELDKDSLKNSDYEIVPIYSYDELHDKFGGDKTGYKGKSEWCHTNGEGTYNSSAWTDNGNYMFIVFAKKGWENIIPPDPAATTAYDDYGTSLIACLFNTTSKELLNSTLRWNHVIDPAKTKLGASVDDAFLNENDLMNTVGIDLTKDLNEYFDKFREIKRITNIEIDGKFFKVTNGNIKCSYKQLSSLKGSPQKVDGYFDCNYNRLTSLKGAPKEVGRNFDCSYNKLTSLKGSPEKIGEKFLCDMNKLTSLKDGPKEVGTDYVCSYNNLTSLEGAPEKVNGSFRCNNNLLTSLKGCPQEVNEYFSCDYNKLTSLEGAPKKINRNFDCTNNQITSLKGGPEKVGGSFYCYNNRLISLEGSPREIGGGFDCTNNQITSLEGAPWKVNAYTSFSGNPNLPEHKIKAYEAYLKLSEFEKAPLTKDNHYYPTEEWENKFK